MLQKSEVPGAHARFQTNDGCVTKGFSQTLVTFVASG